MSGPLFVCAAVVNAEVSVSVICLTTLILTFGCAFSYAATSLLSQPSAPGASSSPQYQYVREALLGSSATGLVDLDAAVVANTVAPSASVAPSTASTCFLAIAPRFHTMSGGQTRLYQRTCQA